MSKMGSHDPFGHLKHKLWPKEGLHTKLWASKVVGVLILRISGLQLGNPKTK
jgi:hypothetical protein